MPYAGNVYSVPPGTQATTLTPIDSSDYNAFVEDIEKAQNDPRPIIAGGTGVDSAINGSSVNTASANRSLLRDIGGRGTVGGTGNAITLLLSLSWTAYGAGDGQIGTGTRILLRAAATNTGATTVNVNSIGTKAVRKIAGGTDVALAGGELVDGQYYDLVYSSTANSSAGGWIVLNPTPSIWLSRAVGEIVYLDTSITGVVEPPTTDGAFRYAKLTAGLTGGGGYNNGILTSESTSGSAPLVLATAVVNLTASPINGQTIRLLNSEGRIVRPSTSAGTLQNDQMQQIAGTFAWIRVRGAQNRAVSGAFNLSTATGLSGVDSVASSGLTADDGQRVNFDSSGSTDARTGTETRAKNIGVTAYMRIL